MSSEFSSQLQAELLDDFFAECDEHLGNLRAQLAALEQTLAKSEPNPAALASLYRSLHSFKGNAAIVGLSSAEALAHAGEGLLRGLTRGEIILTTAALELIERVGHRLEQMVSTFRLQQPVPDAKDILEHLAVYQSAPLPPAGPATTTLPESSAVPSPTLAPGLLSWRAAFSPSPELDARGVNINTVRARLSALGQIVSAVPTVKPGGKMSFEFVVGLREVPSDLASWEADGILLRPEESLTSATEGAGAIPSSMLIAPSHIVRVDLSRLDELMRITGEMVILRSRLEERIAKLSGDRTGLQEVNLAFTRSLRDLREAITRVRLVPVAEIFSRLPFVVRDLARESGKKVRLVLEGQETEIDKYLVERLKEPLLHLVRNAVTHGVEPPAERMARGKADEAVLLLRAAAAGDSVTIEIRDDGRGVDARHVATRAAAAGLPVPEHLDAPALLNLLCTAGFSTREETDRAAGRGVGMAVVANTLRELGGHLTLETIAAEWTKFTLRLPLTLSIAETFIVSAGAHICAVPQGMVDEIIQIRSSDVRVIKKVEVALYRGGVLPLVRLSTLFGTDASAAAEVPVLVVSSERGSTGLVVDRVHGQREVVVRPLQDPLVRVPGISGATELGDGKPVLILDTTALTNGAVRPPAMIATTSAHSPQKASA